MNKKQDINISNMAEVKQALANVPEKIRKRVLRRAITNSLSPVSQAAKKLVTPRRRSGLLRRSISKKVKQYGSGVVVGLVGPTRDTIGEYKGRKAWPNKYAHLIEFGVRPHMQTRRGPNGTQHPGHKAYPFLMPAYQETKTEVLNIVAQTVAREIEKVNS